jgi:hypothetical protein
MLINFILAIGGEVCLLGPENTKDLMEIIIKDSLKMD